MGMTELMPRRNRKSYSRACCHASTRTRPLFVALGFQSARKARMQQTAFIFTAAGEAIGFTGSSALVLLLGAVLWRGLRLAQRAEDMFGVVLAAGIVTWFAFQMFVNIGMTLGIMPITGLPLPFVSYGGSSMMATMMAVGLLQNVHLRTRTTP